jgi:glycine oxidase
MLAPGGEVTQRTGWGDLCLASSILYPRFVSELVAASGEPVDFRRCGAVELALDQQERLELQDRSERQRELGIASRPLPLAELRAMVPILDTSQVCAAQYFYHDAVVDPRQLMQALRAALAIAGVAIREHCRVSAIHPGKPVTVLCGVEKVQADAAVLAAGAWSSEISIPGASIPRSFPVRGHLLGYRLARGLVGPILRHHYTYLVQRRSGRLIAGATSDRAGYNREIQPEAVTDIRTRVERLAPSLLRGLEAEAWLGFRPATDSLAPEIGELPGTGIWLSYGHYRNGMLMAPETARRVSNEILSSLGTA